MLSVLIPVLTNSIRQVSTQAVDNNTRITALTPLESAGRWTGQDIPLAQDTTLPTDGSWQSSLTLGWTSWVDQSQYDTYNATSAIYERKEVTYSLASSDLQRQYRVCDNWNRDTSACDGTWTSQTSVAARKITLAQFSLSGSIFSINVTSYPKGSSHPGEEKTYTVYGALLGSEDPIQ